MIIIIVDVIGGSISGFSTAIALKNKNPSIDVNIHEKNEEIGYNYEGRKCGEAHSIKSEWNKWKPEKNSYFNEIIKVEVNIGNKKHINYDKSGRGYILNRPEFICQLARESEKLGVNILTKDKIKSINDLDGKYIVDASGCPSIVKRELGIKNRMIGIGYQQTIENSNYFNQNTLKIFFIDKYGYFWIFPRNPKKKEINIGIGFIKNFGYNLKELLQCFKEEKKIEGNINHETGGLIPVGLQKPLMHKNILFVGDAGVGTFPISGQGIYRALLSGDIAGKCLAEFKLYKYPKIMKKYFIKWDIIGKTLIFINLLFLKINKKLVLTSLNYFTDFSKTIKF